LILNQLIFNLKLKQIKGRGCVTWIENVMIIFGISFEVFAIMECNGSMVANIKKSRLTIIGVILSLLQLVMLGVGYIISRLLINIVTTTDEVVIGHILAIAIFVLLGIRLIIKALKNDIINEKLEEKMEIKKYILPLVVIGGYTITTGIAAGFCNTNPLNLGILVVVVTWVASYAGMYTGYRAGFEQKTKAYIAGGALLIIVGIDMAIRCFVLG
jgi:putative Mn2+ efflux pump MntP